MRREPSPLPSGMDPEDIHEVNRMLDAAYAAGLDDGHGEGYQEGYADGFKDGEQDGIHTGFREGTEGFKMNDSEYAEALRTRFNYLRIGGQFHTEDHKDRESYLAGFQDALNELNVTAEEPS